MADKKIPDLQLISSVTDSVNIPGDNNVQTYRFTALQLLAYILGKFTGATSVAPAAADLIGFFDASDSNNLKKATLATVLASGSYPTVQRFLTGSGTYTTPAGVKYIKVTMAGGGGGGAGSGTGTPGAGGDGAATTFGTLSAGYGTGAATALNTGGTGGSNSVSITNGILLKDCPGQDGAYGNLINGFAAGGTGASTPLGGGGRGGVGGTSQGLAGEANSGSGGGGGGSPGGGSSYAGAGGSAGGYIETIITSPASTYSYAVGAGGAFGTAGGGGSAMQGGSGADGVIIIEEYYQ